MVDSLRRGGTTNVPLHRQCLRLGATFVSHHIFFSKRFSVRDACTHIQVSPLIDLKNPPPMNSVVNSNVKSDQHCMINNRNEFDVQQALPIPFSFFERKSCAQAACNQSTNLFPRVTKFGFKREGGREDDYFMSRGIKMGRLTQRASRKSSPNCTTGLRTRRSSFLSGRRR